MKCEDLNSVSSVTCEELGQNSINLVENQDYEVVPDQSTLFLKITKRMASQKKHCITIKVLDKDNIEQDWKVFCQPKGWCVGFFLLSRKILIFTNF